MGVEMMTDWILRFIKGMVIGTGALMPGVSGGALAALLGLYEELISFMANITSDFKKNALYFLPVGIGGFVGIVILSLILSFFFERSSMQLIWFFIGCMLGVFPSLVKEAGKKGRTLSHIATSIITATLMFFLLLRMQTYLNVQMSQDFGSWVLAGAMFGLGLLIPGLSPSNFLIYLNLYHPMTEGIKSLDFSVMIPLGMGLLLVIMLFSKLMNFIFEKAYAYAFHLILGVILASTIMIIPHDYNYFSFFGVLCAMACLLGISLGLWMSKLEGKYKKNS